MFKINRNFAKLQSNYLFATIAEKTKAYKAANPAKDVISLGIGDVTLPLPPAVVAAMKSAADEMGRKESFRGYGPYEGFEFLRQAISSYDYKARGVEIAADEIFVSDGAKSDCGGITDLFDADNIIAVQDPVYPVYVDSNVLSGRGGQPVKGGGYDNIIYMPCTPDNNFAPELPSKTPDVIYLCYPNNPTGSVLDYDGLKMWVDYAIKVGAVILYDGAYEAFVTDEKLPRSIYEIPDAKFCAIEMRSFSKTAGFTGTRCAYTVIPKSLKVGGVSLNAMWMRRQATKFNGVSYVIQKGAEAVFSESGRKEVSANIAYYHNNAATIRKGLTDMGFTVFGGVHAPYIWINTGADSWEFFDRLLNEAQVVGTPGSGFGPSGQGFFRLTAFNSYEKTLEALDRIKKL